MATDSNSSLKDANRNRNTYSGHGDAAGAAGHVDDRDEVYNADPTLVSVRGDSALVIPHAGTFEDIKIELAWDNIIVEQGQGFMDKLFRRAQKSVANAGVDIDIGCLYELQNGERGCLQAFGELFGSLKEAPYIKIMGDERTGNTEGADETVLISGKKWPEIKRVLVYIYIYDGVPNWKTLKPEIFIDIPGDEDLKMVPYVDQSELAVCAVGMLENEQNSMRLTNHSEYFPGHAEMDRAFGFGMEWEDGAKE